MQQDEESLVRRAQVNLSDLGNIFSAHQTHTASHALIPLKKVLILKLGNCKSIHFVMLNEVKHLKTIDCIRFFVSLRMTFCLNLRLSQLLHYCNTFHFLMVSNTCEVVYQPVSSPCHCEPFGGRAWQSPGIPGDCFGRLGGLAMTRKEVMCH